MPFLLVSVHLHLYLKVEQPFEQLVRRVQTESQALQNVNRLRLKIHVQLGTMNRFLMKVVDFQLKLAS